MRDDRRRRISKRLSYHLRHAPEDAGVELDRAGWADVDELLEGIADLGVSRRELEEVVADGRKRRFELGDDDARIRAVYGHSVDVDPGHEVAEPPPVLYHGTHRGALDRIREEGLRPMGRRRVHLSREMDQAREVGARRGAPVVLTVDAEGLRTAGHELRPATDGVWLTDRVPPEYVVVLEEGTAGETA